MITRNGNLFITENAIGLAQQAMEIVRDKLNVSSIIGVEWPCDRESVGDILNVGKPIVCCMIYGIEGGHMYIVDVETKTIKVYRG